MIVGDKENIYLLSGNGDVIESDDGVLATGSGGMYASAAAKALIKHSNLSALEIVQEALKIAFTEVLSGRAPESRGNGLKFVRKIIKDEIKSVPIKLYFQTGSASLILERGNDYKMSTPEKSIGGCLVILTY